MKGYNEFQQWAKVYGENHGLTITRWQNFVRASKDGSSFVVTTHQGLMELCYHIGEYQREKENDC